MICTFTLSFWRAATSRQQWFIVLGSRERRFESSLPQRLFHSDPVTPLHSYSYCPTLEGIIFKRCNKKQPVCLSPKPPSRWSPCLSHRRSHRLPAAGVSLDVNGGKICWVRFSPGFTLLPVFQYLIGANKKSFLRFQFSIFFYQCRFSPGFTLLAFDNLRTVAPNSICDWCFHQMRAEVAKRTERQFFLLVLLLMLSIHTWLWIRRLWSLQLLSYPSLLQVPISPKFEANFWPDERLEQVRIPLSCWRPFFNCSVSGKPTEKKSTILWQQF